MRNHYCATTDTDVCFLLFLHANLVRGEKQLSLFIVSKTKQAQNLLLTAYLCRNMVSKESTVHV